MGYDFSKSNLALMVGGQLVMIVIAIMVVLFGVRPIQFEYAEQMRNMLSTTSTTAINSSNTQQASKK